MTTGPQHYKQAEDLRELSRGKDLTESERLGLILKANYHATMAQTAAIVELLPRESATLENRRTWSRLVGGRG